MATSDDGKTVAATDGRSTILVRGTDPPHIEELPPDQQASAIGISPSGRYVLVLTSVEERADQAITLIDTSSGQRTTTSVDGQTTDIVVPSDTEAVLYGHGTAEVQALQFQPDLKVLSRSRPDSQFFGAHALATTISTSGRFFGYSNGGPSVPLWKSDEPSPSRDRPDHEIAVPAGDVQQLAISDDDGGRVAIAEAGTVSIISGSGAEPTALEGTAGEDVSKLAFLGDGTRLMSVVGGRVALWNLKQLSRIASQSTIDIPASCSACDAPRVSVTDDARTIAISPDAGGYPPVIDGDKSKLPPAADPPDGPTVSPDGSVSAEIVVAGGRRVAVLKNNKYGETSAALPTVSPEAVTFSASYLLVRRMDGGIEVWDRNGSMKMKEIFGDPTSIVGPTPVSGTPFAVVLRSDSVAVLLDLDSGTPIGTFRLPSGPRTRSTGIGSMSPGLLVSATESDYLKANGVVQRWRLVDSAWVATACATAGRNITAEEWEHATSAPAPASLKCAET